MLQNADTTNNSDVLVDISLLAVQLQSVMGMAKIVKDYFSTSKVSKTLLDDIKELNRLYEVIELNETLKIHVVLHHLEHCLAHGDNNIGLRMGSGQAGESICSVLDLLEQVQDQPCIRSIIRQLNI